MCVCVCVCVCVCACVCVRVCVCDGRKGCSRGSLVPEALKDQKDLFSCLNLMWVYVNRKQKELPLPLKAQVWLICIWTTRLRSQQQPDWSSCSIAPVPFTIRLSHTQLWSVLCPTHVLPIFPTACLGSAKVSEGALPPVKSDFDPCVHYQRVFL